ERPGERTARPGCPSKAASLLTRPSLFQSGVPSEPFPQYPFIAEARKEIFHSVRNDGISRDLSEPAGDVRLRPRITGRSEELRRRVELNELPGQEKCAEVADACRLLHVVRDDDNRAGILQLYQQFFNFRGADRVES